MFAEKKVLWDRVSAITAREKVIADELLASIERFQAGIQKEIDTLSQ
jgi:hypothetical protein